MEKTSKAKILEFRQGSDFHLKRGDYHVEKNDPLSAVRHYRKAFEQDPADPDACMALAEQLNVMHRFGESNRLMFVFMSMHEMVPEFFFGIACNFFGINEFEYAADALYAYLQTEPEGDFYADAVEFLDVLEDDDELAYTAGIGDDEDFDTVTICTRAQSLISSGEYEIAAELLLEQIREKPGEWRPRALYAGTLSLMGKPAGALNEMRKLFDEDPSNLTVRCGLAHLYHRAGKDKEAEKLIRAADASGCEVPDVWRSLASVQSEIGMKKEALESIREADILLPFDRDILHLYACICRETGDLDGAERCYEKLFATDPDDTVASYYLASIRLEKKTGGREVWNNAYDVPAKEAVLRIERIRDALAEEDAGLKQRWESDAEFRALLKWALGSAPEDLRLEILAFYARMADSRAEAALRDFALREDQKDSAKQRALACLSEMNAPEPYMAYLESQWIQSRVSTSDLPKDIPAAYTEAMGSLAVHLCRNQEPRRVLACAMQLLQGYLHRHSGYIPKMNASQREAFAAALDYLGSQMTGNDVSVEEVCGEYRITPKRLNNALEKLLPILKGND